MSRSLKSRACGFRRRGIGAVPVSQRGRIQVLANLILTRNRSQVSGVSGVKLKTILQHCFIGFSGHTIEMLECVFDAVFGLA